MKKEVKAECGSCGGTGLYTGFAEPVGTAVICITCQGTGCQTISYTPFTQRKRRNNITTISQSRGGLVATGIGSVGRPISYEEFQRGKMP